MSDGLEGASREELLRQLRSLRVTAVSMARNLGRLRETSEALIRAAEYFCGEPGEHDSADGYTVRLSMLS